MSKPHSAARDVWAEKAEESRRTSRKLQFAAAAVIVAAGVASLGGSLTEVLFDPMRQIESAFTHE